MNTEIQPLRLILKALVMLVVINILYALADPPVYKISLYNTIFPGRVRLPFDDGSEGYTVMVDDVDFMFASHVISKPKSANEYRVALLGDSSIWGENLTAQESLSEQWNRAGIQCSERSLKFYNLGYPHPSVIKDLIILDKAVEHEPDLIIWFVTLNTLIPQRLSPFLLANREKALNLLQTYNIPFKYEKELLEMKESVYQQTLLGERSDLARWMKLQALGVIWAGTDADSGVPIDDTSTISPDLENEVRYKGTKSKSDLNKLMLFQALQAGHEIAGSIPILIVNEPMYIASGGNTSVRYNDVYPRWAYDYYRKILAANAKAAKWNYRDMWKALPPKFFPHTSLHFSADGVNMLIQKLNPTLQKIACH
jgi:hypothetical protein